MYIIKTYRCQLVADGQAKFLETTADCADTVANIFFEKLANLPHEEVHALYVNGRNRITGHQVLAIGGQHGCALTTKDVMRGAIVANASAFILAHNHPSGNPTPSQDDIVMTRTVMNAAELLGCPLFDHLVVCPEARIYRSVKDLVTL